MGRQHDMLRLAELVSDSITGKYTNFSSQKQLQKMPSELETCTGRNPVSEVCILFKACCTNSSRFPFSFVPVVFVPTIQHPA
jgi:hypothetical protein